MDTTNDMNTESDLDREQRELRDIYWEQNALTGQLLHRVHHRIYPMELEDALRDGLPLSEKQFDQLRRVPDRMKRFRQQVERCVEAWFREEYF